jgi:hypothetical protein
MDVRRQHEANRIGRWGRVRAALCVGIWKSLLARLYTREGRVVLKCRNSLLFGVGDYIIAHTKVAFPKS